MLKIAFFWVIIPKNFDQVLTQFLGPLTNKKALLGLQELIDKK
ncbi:hypothetical protein D1AOALGA4SA_4665 [Olavius algarvensis Delta 1 endosymbiont]|nr:hypothetical protein D1AOALGA4SA_4665 [Olavius algarvensis Delta 1 endosymbiont]